MSQKKTKAPNGGGPRGFGVGATMQSSTNKDKQEAKQSQAGPQFDWLALQHVLQFYQDNHLCCIPVPFGEKKYNFHHAGNQGWESFQKERPSQRQIDQWFKEDTPTNIAIVCGGVSNGLVALCFNEPNGAELFFGKERWEKLPSATFIPKTSRGQHVYLRSSIEIISQDFTKDGKECWLEIRSDGRYIMAPPSKHPSGLVYTNIGAEKIFRPKDLPSFITKRLSELGLKVFKASKKAKPPLTELDRKVEELLRKNLTLDQIAKEVEGLCTGVGLYYSQMLMSLDHIDLPGLFSEVKSEDSPDQPYNAITCHRLLNKDKLTLTQAREACKEIYAKVQARGRAEHAEGDDKLAVEKLLTNCAFMAYCADRAITLSEPYWWSMVNILIVFGGPGRAKIHELSRPYPGYTEKETEQKIEEALKAGEKDIGPHTCVFVQDSLGFSCPGNCLAKKEAVKSPAGLAHRLATPKTFHLTDTGNAERLTKRYGDRLHYSETRKKWLIWNGKVWKWDYGAKVMAFSKRTARATYIEAAREADDGESKAILKHAVRSEKKDRRVAMVDLSISEPNIAIELDELDTNPWLFCCKNGTIDLRTGELKPHDKDDLITKMSPVEYDLDAQCSLWQKFLARITDNDTELQGYLQRAAGYSLCGDIRAQVLFFLYGAGNNGKSTFLNTISKIIAGYSHKAPMELFATKGRQESTTESLANLHGKRFVYAGEVEEGRRLRLNLIKDITGGETIRADRKYEHEIEFLPTFKLWLYGNHKPFIMDNTIATWRRLREIPFTVVISDDEVDQELPKKLEAEQSGILTWMVKGCLDWQRRALSEPAAVSIATNAYRAEMDILGEFIEECCIIQPTATATKKDLYNAYKQWCPDNNNQPIPKRTFGTRLGERGITDKKVHDWFWCGIRLNDTTQGTLGDIKSENTGTFLHGGVEGKFPQNSESMSLNVPPDTKSGGIKPENTGFPITKNGKKPKKCPVCGGTDFWKRVTGEWVCANCHPQPQEIDMEF